MLSEAGLQERSTSVGDAGVACRSVGTAGGVVSVVWWHAIEPESTTLRAAEMNA